MKPNQSKPKPKISRCFLFSLLLSLFLLFLVSIQYHRQPETLLAFTSTITGSQKQNATNPDIRIRPGYASYDAYIQRQLNKTLNPKLRKIWTTRDWNRKINVFSNFFSELREKGFLSNSTKALCVGARVGQEVEALRRIGVSDSIGIDLVPYPPLVIRGDFHKQPFDDQVFDFEFSNVFDHALYPDKFVGEIERTLKPGGVCVLHVALSTRSDKFSANDLYSIKGLISLFRSSELVHTRKVDGFGLDTEAVFRKKKLKQSS
ncbi:hypothetical protein DCAR_0207940 [Daucus carota subsp. sativus]|uniref:Methyltransferase type 11 domain-containing protein n=1 Tax=Daucus carota subsp. sativus TaxID=79200 RepID=A0AAF0WIF5_DAUCS|nr:PREDICTED: uncharacterized protein LOC108210078 [Daucus carota subsp. sativus]WOG88705.1 hypothetical protein DCAR_0207940 [Daucus carota subsp. sativus]